MNISIFINILAYIIIFICIYFVLWLENRDNKCSELWNKNAICNYENGMPWRNSKPLESDNYYQLLKRIKNASNAESNSIKWRRSLILSFIISLLFWILIIGCSSYGFTSEMCNFIPLPRWEVFLLTLLSSFTVLYYSFNYYSYHIFSIPANHIHESLKILKKYNIENL